jgi:histone H3/H4
MTDFKIYNKRILAQVHPEVGLQGSTNVILNNIEHFLVQKIMNTANNLLKLSDGKTLTDTLIKSSIRMVYIDNLSIGAIRQIDKSVKAYNNYISQSKEKISRSHKADLQISVSRIEKLMRSYTLKGCRLSSDAVIAVAASVEYIIAEVVELAGNAARDNKKIRISPRHISLAIKLDIELQKLFSKTHLGGGVIPNIHSSLLPKKSKK